MSVIVLVLKIIGILLLILLGILLTALFAVLFVPVRYRVFGQVEDGVEVHMCVSWLFHLLSFSLEYRDGEKRMGGKLFGFSIRRKPRRTSVLDAGEWKDEPEDAVAKDAWEDAQAVRAESGESLTENESEAVGADTGKHAAEDATKAQSSRRDAENPRSNGRQRFLARLRGFFRKLRRIKENAGKIWRKLCSFRDLVREEANKVAFLAVLAELKYLFLHFKIRKLAADLRFGAGDPALTGQALGVLCIFPFLYRYQVNLVPDFESGELYVRGVFDMRGRMRAVHFIVSLARLWKKKEVRNLVNQLLGQ